MKILIVDDEPLARERLAFGLSDLPDVTIVGEAADGIAASEMIASLAPDLVILDIQMPGRTGLAVAAALARDTGPQVIFVTAFEHYAADAFEIDATDYLIKPVRFDRLRQAVARARRRREERDAAALVARHGLADGPSSSAGAAAAADAADSIFVPDPRGNRYIPVKAIEWIEAARDYVLLHTPERAHMVRMTMAELERRLDPALMVRVHRSAFVRRDAVLGLEATAPGQLSVRLSDDIRVRVGPSYQRRVEAELGSTR